ncbi:MAG: ABC transporter substrate-binding protein [Firmicutes bacterium]|nr:ABC transporter substrate-binding protein [Bacillota bacterium]
MEGREMRRIAGASAIGALSLFVAFGGATTANSVGASLPGRSAGSLGRSVTLTLWENYGTEDEATATYNLVRAFEKLHPNIKINVASQPASNYFSLLQAAAISRTGPDLTVMWSGLYALKYSYFLVNLNNYLPKSLIRKVYGIKYSSLNFNPSDGVIIAPLENQFYMGFYNKALFKKAGISSPPTDWTQLFRDSAILKKHGITPLLYGSGSQSIGAEFYPFYDLSYLMAGVYSPSQWKGLYDGQIPWTSAPIKAQLAKWVSLYRDGYTNRNALTATNILSAFEQGKGAMLIKGNWDVNVLEKAMGSKLGVFLPPFSSKPVHSVVMFPGDGYSMTTYSQHKAQAAEFLRFVLSPEGQKIESQAGLIPDVKGSKTNNPLNNQLLSYAAKGYTVYPMIDNMIQPNVVDAGSKELDAAFVGNISVIQALQNLEQTLKNLPASQRSSHYN